MMISSLPIPFRDIVLGQAALVVCCLAYLAWWCVAFRPGVSSGGWFGGLLLVVLMLFAAAGIFLDVSGIRALWDGAAGRAALRVLLAGALAYPFVCGMAPLGLDALVMMFVTWRLVP